MNSTDMNAIVLDRFGAAAELTPRRIPLPAVGDDDVLIRVQFAGAASWDTEEREGHYDNMFGIPTTFPYVLGWDAAGTVAAVGRNVTRFDVGDRVYAATMPAARGGCYAEFVAVEAEFVAHVPDRLPTDQAGAMAWDAVTALSGLDTLGLQPGETLMIFGASGGIGHMAVQLARHHGARVLAVVSGDDGVELARRSGADHVVDGHREDVPAAAREFAPDGLDAALVTGGSAAAEKALHTVRESGRIAWPNGVMPVPATPPGVTASAFDGDRSRTTTDRLNAIIEASTFQVHLAGTFPLEQAREAHLALAGHYVGKLALSVS
ncbi:quinone oxidoreductase [Actinoplanes sichuanensis]|uniref:Zinc-binding alcohol dehydrogenase family protein n=1 Tax=Actinoplanes sichuanensis TaxID=512349 RepID=A0ABW4AN39_9ACTN|nr:NADP-dependent oxidoreductase [Actinoplanes sichuanensis]BEL06270.1 quinone oxidoreductase [Actinoplanes sichuanensis]